ncbi:MAG: NADP-dependent oxidoreductase [Pseudomonadales bacterium]|nr:NADP-dependent oxidoreductase [Pseudomonadales bacterium]NRA15851.1 NADP-dependent oxidoreductase [Oceanospirillaceae bacterium]
MKAALIENYGDIQQLIVTETQIPTIAADQVLIKVHAAGVNPVDFYIRSGMFKDTGTHSLPLTLGWDTAGTIEQIGERVTEHKVGDQVFALAPFAKNGSYAEYLAIEADIVVSKPKHLSFAESAAVPLAALTAWQGLFTEGKLKAGQRVLIHNTSGGVGSFAVQLAKAAGAYVIGTASKKNREFVESLGVDEFIDYQNNKFEGEVAPVDLVFAAVGGDDIVARSLAVIKAGGHLISLFDEIDEVLATEQQVTYQRLWVQPNAADLTQIKDLLEQGKVQVHLDSLFPLADAQLAHQRSESKRTVGKIVLQVIAD